MLERDYICRLLATINEFEARSGVRPTVNDGCYRTSKHRKRVEKPKPKL